MEGRGQHQEALRSVNRKNMVIYSMLGVGEKEGSVVMLILLIQKIEDDCADRICGRLNVLMFNSLL